MINDRQTLRATICNIIRMALGRPRYHAAEQLADELTVVVRQAQHDAWTRGYAAAQLDDYDHKNGRSTNRRSPYNGGRHAGQPVSACFSMGSSPSGNPVYPRMLPYSDVYKFGGDMPGDTGVFERNSVAVDNETALSININNWPDGAIDLTDSVHYPQTNPHPEGK